MMTLKTSGLILVVLLFVNCETSWGEGIPSITQCGRVHITVSSVRDSNIELNWVTNCQTYEAPEIIALFHQDPKLKLVPPIVSINAKHYPNGYYLTRIPFDSSWLPDQWDNSLHYNYTKPSPGPRCFPYWVASIRSGRLKYTNCLKIQPTWMNDNKHVLGPQRIGTIFIPGTHNSGAYNGIGYFEKYLLNQDRDIWTQLVFGIRYLDFRVGYYHNDGFYLNHDLVRITKLAPLLKEIRRFLEMAPKEIVVLDFHRFPYPSKFDVDIHKMLVDLVQSELGHLALPPSGLQVGKGPTINEIWQQNKTLIICYGQRQVAKAYSWLWNPIQQHWGDKRKVDELKDYLRTTIKNHNSASNPMWALMAELTLSSVDVIFGTNNIRKLADRTNRHLTKWFRDEWAKETNIVATDYFLGNDLINVAIEANKFV